MCVALYSIGSCRGRVQFAGLFVGVGSAGGTRGAGSDTLCAILSAEVLKVLEVLQAVEMPG